MDKFYESELPGITNVSRRKQCRSMKPVPEDKLQNSIVSETIAKVDEN